jgi:osmotically-inducible protein OsmY
MTQTDILLGDKVSSALQRNPYISGRSLFFETTQGRVVLKGTVRSYFQKQMAQEAIRSLDGVHEIQNELQVCSTRSRPA